MRAAMGGVLLGLGVLVGVAVGFPEALGQRPGLPQPVAGSPDLLALSFDAGDGRQQIAVLDPRQRALAVYHIDRASGAVSLKCVRNLQYDLLIEDFNTAPGTPTPREIRTLAQPR